MIFFGIKKFLGFFVILTIFLGFILSLGCAVASAEHFSDSTPLVTASYNTKHSSPCCKVSVIHNNDSLRNIFFNIYPRSGRDLAALIFSLILISAGFSQRIFKSISDRARFVFYKLYIKNKPNLFLHKNLKFTFALGTPNPKIY